MNRRYRLLASLSLAVVLAVGAASAFSLTGQRWPTGNTVTMYLQLGSTGGALIDGATSWDALAADQIQKWNNQIGSINFTSRTEPKSRLSGDGVNDVFWSNDVFGDAFGAEQLAVTVSIFRDNIKDESNVVFNLGKPFNSYRGALRQGANDFARVALHEFGHVLGLNHPDDAGQSVTAVMNSKIGDADDLKDDDLQGIRSIYGAPPKPSLSLPARQETILFRQALEAKYRDGLRRPAQSTFVTLDDIAVWGAEYIGYRVNGCGHAEATARVMAQIEGRGVQPLCSTAGTIDLFPSANDTAGFRAALETEYRDVLARASNNTSVDADGDATWISEYVRLRLTGVGDADATANVLSQVDTAFAAPGQRAQLAISTSLAQPFDSIEVTVNGRSVGTLKQPVDAGAPPSCTAIPDARIVATVAPGGVSYSARSNTGISWSGSTDLPAGQCLELRLSSGG